MRVAVIPARGGSKRIPRKNIKIFCGKPIIGYSIETAKNSGLFDRVIVSTDDQEIAEVSEKFGAEIPFMRPKNLADDFTGTTDVIAHAASWLKKEKVQPETICCLYPAAPFVHINDLTRGCQAIETGKWDYAFPVTDYGASIFRSFKQLSNGGLQMFFPDMFAKRSQDLPEAFHDAGQFYWGTAEAWITKKIIFGPGSFPIRIPRWRVQDIDTPDDWLRAELMYQSYLNHEEET